MLATMDGRRAKRGPLRSSIACLRCRKSKIKCDNRGPTGPCDTCIKTGKECRYPDQAAVPPKRHELPGLPGPDHPGGAERKRLRRHDDASHPGSSYPASVAEDVLSAHYLTPSLWYKLFSIYTQHFRTELPFLHLPTLKEMVGRKREGSQSGLSPETNLVLLGVLALTARFEPSLVQYVTSARSPLSGSAKTRPLQHSPDASAASEYFAEALVAALGPLSMCMTAASVERVQAFLMLGLYEWIQSKPKTGGFGAWMYVGHAIRMAQALRLGFGDRPDNPQAQIPGTLGVASSSSAVPPPQLIVSKEVRRRTMFSCLILDRMLSCGKDCVSAIRSEDLQIRLPSAEFDFDYSADVSHRFLKGGDEGGDGRPRPHKTDSVLGCFIRLVDVWGEISKFTFAGGRLSEKRDLPPWYEASRFRQLREELDSFYSGLPEVYTWSMTNFHRHWGSSGGSIFVSLHMLGSLCQIMLHREYIPFIPIRCGGPIGPLDGPTFPNPPFAAPEGFWEESAELVFGASENIVEVIRLCEGNVPMSSLVLFAIWTASFVGIYAFHFPHMDTRGHMLSPGDRESRAAGAPIDVAPSGGDATPISTTYQALARMSQQLRLAGSFVKTFHEMDQYYRRVCHEFHKYDRRSQSLAATGASGPGGRLSIVHGGEGGGLEEWKRKKAKIVNNGVILEADEKHDASDIPSRGSTVESGLSCGPEAQADRPGHMLRSAATGSFTAINSSAPPSLSQQQQQQQQQQTTGPSPGPPGAKFDPLPRVTEWQSYATAGFQTPTPPGVQAAYIMAGGAPQLGLQMMGGLTTIPAHGGLDFIDYLHSAENVCWNLMPGGVHMLAHGSDSPGMYMEAQMEYLPPNPEVPGAMLQQVGAYE